jgi:NTP pyrophosphatase (non-canonical NTP hydrolase)
MLYYLVQIAHDWAVRSFGAAQMANKKTRALRLVEEAIELCQAVGVDEVDVLKTLAHVYAGEPGEPIQEMGGVLLTAFLMTRVMDVPVIGTFVRELRRVLAKDPAIWAARNANKVNITAEEAKAALDKAVAALPVLDKAAVDFVVPQKYTIGYGEDYTDLGPVWAEGGDPGEWDK